MTILQRSLKIYKKYKKKYNREILLNKRFYGNPKVRKV